MSGRPANGLTRGGPMFNEVVAERVAAKNAENKYTGINLGAAAALEQKNAENKYTGINLNAAAALEQQNNDRGYFMWKLSQTQTKKQRNNPAKYEEEFRQRYKNYLAGRGGSRRKHRRTRKHKKTHRRR